MDVSLHSAQATFAANHDRYRDEWYELLRFPSISADPAQEGACRDCAMWLQHHLEGMGFQAELLETATKPVVFATTTSHVATAPRVLFYGHYDVQPVDPVPAWDTPPFEPTLRNGRVYARGAQDNKGQFFAALKAIETLLNLDQLPVHLTVVIEGEEEHGSTGLANNVSHWAERLASDVLMVADTGTVPSGQPTIVAGLRGLIALAVRLSGPSRDLHSGLHGGVAPNPATAMARLLATLHDTHGAIAIPGFTDGVIPPSAAEQALLAREPTTLTSYAAAHGVPPIAGESDYTIAERVGFRPALDINGITTGHTAGFKTIIPAEATARITGRLAAGQDPDRCLALLTEHLQQHAPPGLSLDVFDCHSAGAGFRVPLDSAPLAAARRALSQLADSDPVIRWEGASVPIIPALAAAAGAAPILVGFGHDDDHIHAPNESFSWNQFERGYLYTLLMLQELARGSGA